MTSNQPVKNGCEVIYEMFYTWNCGFEILHGLNDILLSRQLWCAPGLSWGVLSER